MSTKKVNDPDTVLKTEIDDEYLSTEFCGSECGYVFLSKTKKVFLSCKFCLKNFINLDRFTEHLFEDSHSYYLTMLNNFENNKEHSSQIAQVNTAKLNIDVAKTEDTFSHDHESSVVDGDSGDSKSIDVDDNIKPKIECKKKKSVGLREEKHIKPSKFSVTLSKGKWQCPICKEIFKRGKERIVHEKIHKNVETFICEKESKPKPITCSDNLQKSTLLKGKWQCPVCQHICKRGKERKVHEKIHTNVKRLICETCGKGYNSNCLFVDHIRTHTGEKPFKCRFCPKTFFSYSSMKSHDKTHIGFKPFRCDYCKHGFKSTRDKRIHEKKYHQKDVDCDEDKKRFQCTLCSRSFQYSSQLSVHVKRHENALTKTIPKKPFQCNFCPATFNSNSGRNDHEKLFHKGQFNFKCDYCGKGFLKLDKKKTHELTHTRIENTYACDLCEKKYARPEGLRKHKRMQHNTETPYKCETCQAGFASSLQFQEHCKQHNIQEKPFFCIHCELRFEIEIQLRRHLKKVHNNVEGNKVNEDEKVEDDKF